MDHTTGFTKDRVVEPCAQVHAANEVAAEPEKVTWPPIPGLLKAVVATLTSVRRNRVQAETGEVFGVSPSTTSRAITAITPPLNKTPRLFVPTADEPDDKTQHVADGTLPPCSPRASQPQPYSGKQTTTGMNTHAAATPGGRLAWMSDPIDGTSHDSHRPTEAALPTGNNMITPLKKPPYRDLLDGEKELNTQVNKIRWVTEQVITHLKTWRTLDTGCRRPTGTFPETIPAVIAPHFWRSA